MSIKQILKAMLSNESVILKTGLWLYNHLPFNNRIKRGGKNRLRATCAQLKHCTVVCSGTGNTVEIRSGSRLIHGSISIQGNNNTVVIDPRCYLRGVDICIEDDNNTVTIGEHSSFQGNVHLACIEGTTLAIGKDCMFSANISIRTGDSHSLVDENGERINPSKDVCIGDHVWIGNTVLITKGVAIAEHSVVGTGSVVTRQFDQGHVVLAGNPARIVKTSVSWERERLPIKESV